MSNFIDCSVCGVNYNADTFNAGNPHECYRPNVIRHAIQRDEDIKFLLDRATRTGKVALSGERDTGSSSNSIVAIAYGAMLYNQVLPSDKSDLRSCENMWAKLPEHRKTGNALMAMDEARKAVKCD